MIGLMTVLAVVSASTDDDVALDGDADAALD